MKTFLFLALLLSSTVAYPVQEAEYDRVIEQARQGKTSEAIRRLEQWVVEFPQQLRYLYDLVVVLGWAEQHEKAVSFWPKLDRPETPSYALKALAHSARKAEQHAIAEQAYRRWLTQESASYEAQAGLVLNWAVQGRIDEALDYALEKLRAKPYTAAHVPLLHSLASLWQAKQRWFDSAAVFDEILRIMPSDRAAYRERSFMLSRMGAAHLAIEYITAQPTWFTAEEKSSLQEDRISQLIRWGEAEIAWQSGLARFSTIDRALQENELFSQHSLRSAFDRLIALRDRVRMAEVIALYHSLQARGVELPAYTLSAAADAFLYQKQPEQARDLYGRALAITQNEPGAPNSEWQLGLFYAYIECEQFSAARELIDRMVADEPPFLYRGMRGVELDNPMYARLRLSQALLRLYADQLAESETLLHTFLDQAPFNISARTAWGSLRFAREHPRAAQRIFQSVLVDEPKELHAQIGLAETLLSLRDYRRALLIAEPLWRDYPENRAVQNLARQWQAYQARLLTLEARIGRSDGGINPSGNRDLQIDSHLYSAPLAYHWRGYVRHFYAQARFDEVTVSRQRLGLGMHYRAADWQAQIELRQALPKHDEVAIALSGDWQANDHWTIRAGVEGKINDLAMKAHAAGISARRGTLGVSYTTNESQRLASEFSLTEFSDDNRRSQLNLSGSQRMLSSPVYKLIAHASLYASRNSLRDAVYFNPRHDAAFELSVVNEWLTWRRYQRNFKQRLALSVGHYHQADFAGASTYGLRYEHEWERDGRFTLRYGIGSNRHPYDGIQETRRFAYLSLNWIF